jgi:hypothetical protein
MSSLADADIAALEAKLDQASAAFAQVQSEGHFLEGPDAERINEKLERLHSQIMEVTPPIPMSEVYERLGGEPVSPEEFAELDPRASADRTRRSYGG